MELTSSSRNRRVYRIVLTGGPCGGKTTGQSRLCTFFENLGWKVFRVPETASILLSGGVKFSDLTSEDAFQFQENLLKTMIQIENTFFQLGERCNRDCLIICDRGTMDASAYISKEDWEKMMKNSGWNPVELRDTRYHQIIHMVSAAQGAAEFYGLEGHSCRSENLDMAISLDDRTAEAWIGHPYFDVIDNSTEFDTKIRRMISAVCQRMGLDTGDRLETNARKVKFLVGGLLPADSEFPPFEDFDVIHDYLQTNSRKTQARLRKRGQKDRWSYTITVRRPEVHGQVVETKTQITSRDYANMLEQLDPHHLTIFKKRRCFLYNNQYFQLDIYTEPCHPRCQGLMLLETYTTQSLEELQSKLPDFLNIVRNVTGDPAHSMYNLSLKDEWLNNKKFCYRLTAEDDDDLTGSPQLNGWVGPHTNGSHLLKSINGTNGTNGTNGN